MAAAALLASQAISSKAQLVFQSVRILTAQLAQFLRFALNAGQDTSSTPQHQLVWLALLAARAASQKAPTVMLV